MSRLCDQIAKSIVQANKAYEEASTSLEQINALYNALPIEDALHRQEVRDIREQAVQAKDLTIQVRHDLEVLQAGLQALESVRGE